MILPRVEPKIGSNQGCEENDTRDVVSGYHITEDILGYNNRGCLNLGIITEDIISLNQPQVGNRR